jgi:hypothetical protein
VTLGAEYIDLDFQFRVEWRSTRMILVNAGEDGLAFWRATPQSDRIFTNGLMACQREVSDTHELRAH